MKTKQNTQPKASATAEKARKCAQYVCPVCGPQEKSCAELATELNEAIAPVTKGKYHKAGKASAPAEVAQDVRLAQAESACERGLCVGAALFGRAMEYKAQRDELLAVCKMVRDWNDGDLAEALGKETIEARRAVILAAIAISGGE